MNIQKFVHNKIQSQSQNTSLDLEYESLEEQPNENDDIQILPNDIYYLDKGWIMAQILITFGEVGNFTAYGFAPATLIAPLGTVALVRI